MNVESLLWTFTLVARIPRPVCVCVGVCNKVQVSFVRRQTGCAYMYVHIYVYMDAYVYGCICVSMILIEALRRYC